MEEGTLGDWLKQEGDPVTRGDPLFILEGEKATQDVESLDSGLLRLLPSGPQPGDVVQVGQLLAYLVEEGEAAPFEEPGYTAPSPQPKTESPAHVSAAPSAGSASRPSSGRIAITPRARRRARETGVDWTTIQGSGRDGRIREIDIVSASRHSQVAIPDGPGHLQPLPPVRRVIARRLAEASSRVPTVTLFRTVRAENLVARQVSEGASYTMLIMHLVAQGLRSHPVMNSSWTEQGIFFPDDVNIAFAVDTEEGLLAPVVPQADTLSLEELDALGRSLAGRAKAGELRPPELIGGTFTISNLGMHGVEEFTPLLNPPQCATLGIGAIAALPVCEGDAVVPGQVLRLSLTFDHRIVDGGPAARFLDDICQRIAGLQES
jgi:pyruvate dehydrogenase E2 component (dihydrolipoamide acetyltransferase)